MRGQDKSAGKPAISLWLVFQSLVKAEQASLSEKSSMQNFLIGQWKFFRASDLRCASCTGIGQETTEGRIRTKIFEENRKICFPSCLKQRNNFFLASFRRTEISHDGGFEQTTVSVALKFTESPHSPMSGHINFSFLWLFQTAYEVIAPPRLT